ncbi:MAG: glycosyltransferase family 39 protein [Deltaproteobacteria bacterium]|jgi:undecaprenyl-diphosphatase|nr:glycosyltransferase family 39 protein [Deltaproteobacteria bacterium]
MQKPKFYTYFFWGCLSLFTLFQLFCLAFSTLELSGDEAHYWDWSRRLDWAYYSKGPLVAVCIYLSRIFFGDTEFAVRFPALCFITCFSVIYYYFVKQNYGAKLAFWSWLAIRTTLIFIYQGFIFTTDPLVSFFYLLAVMAFYNAVYGKSRWCWQVGFVAVGLGALAKYTILILPCFVFLFLWLTPQQRWHLKQLNFGVAVILGVLSLTPILIWNVQHDWVNFAHNAGHIISQKGLEFKPRCFFEFLGGQLGVIGPCAFIGILFALYYGCKEWLRGDIKAGLLFWTSFPLLAFCVLVSLFKSVYANWAMPSYISGSFLIVHLVDKYALLDRVKIFYLVNLFINLLFSLLVFLLIFGITLGITGKYLPTKRLTGIKEVAQQTAHLIQSEFKDKSKEVIIATDRYMLSSLLAFYLPESDFIYNFFAGNRRMNQFDIWGGWEQLKGKDILLVTKSLDSAWELQDEFEALEQIGECPYIEVSLNRTIVYAPCFFIGYAYSGKPQVVPKTR